jgi:A/G-specific adenine glycosylase
MSVRSRLLTWFARHQRELPWRKTADPYAIWISEVMLQQTQVATVIPYYRRFLERFPTVRALAKAQLPDVLGLWKGLGYYSRARNLHRAAQQLAAEHGGALPSTAEALHELPGFGRYTAGAVASIAFGEEAPLVDGNVARVLSRLYAVEGAPGEKAREAKLWALAGELVKGPKPGDLNQALMELGATVCLPKAPLCLLCPVSSECTALKEGRVDQLPAARFRAPRKALELSLGVCRKGQKVLLARRPDGGLFGGLWELPSAPSTDALTALLDAPVGERLAIVERTLTHRDLTLHLYEVKSRATLKRLEGYPECRWVTQGDVEPLGVSAAMQAALEHVWAR